MEPTISIEHFEIFAGGLDHPECLAFDQHGDLWAGGEAGQIYRISPKGTVEQVATLGTFNAGLAFSPSDELFICNPATGIIRVQPNGKFDTFASHAGDHKIVCSNFGAFDSHGNYYVTDSGHWKKGNGQLCRFTPDGRGEIIAGPFGYVNGLALSADESMLYMVESDTNRVHRFRLHDDGRPPDKHIHAEEVGRMPDGLALDAHGNLFASCYASDEIWKITPTGEKSLFAWDRWAILLSRPTNMAFGGDAFDTMYVANLGRTTITRAKVGFAGQRLSNLKM